MGQDSVESIESPRPQAQALTAPVLASRVDRFLATILDVVVGLVVGIPLSLYTGLFHAISNGQPVPWDAYLENTLGGWAWFFLANGYWLKAYGQTVGKRLLGIRISEFNTERVPPFWRLVVRIAVTPVAVLFGALGNVFSLVDALFIFSKKRRCLHDLIANTRVLNTWSRTEN